jgi:23S rRNA (uracil1939-C5)-methyltransferase
VSDGESAAQEVAVHGLTARGEGVGRLSDGRVVFVEDALPGDRVLLTLEEQSSSKTAKGTVQELLEASSDRVEAECQRERCGGCPVRSFSVDAQRREKQQRVVETLRRIGKVDVAEHMRSIISVGDGLRYRHRARLHCVWQEDEWQLGYHAKRSNELVPLSGCPVLWPELDTVLEQLGRRLRELPKHVGLDSIEVSYSRRDARAAATMRIRGDLSPVRRAFQRLDPLSGLEVFAKANRWRFGNLGLRYDHRRALEFDLGYEAGCFTQAFPEVNDALVDAVTTAVKPQSHPRVLELHAGIGNFSVPLARAGASLVAVERNRRSAVLNRRNAQRAGARYSVLPVSDHEAAGPLRDADVVVLDPPRIGAKDVCALIAKSHASRVVYVSCDPATLARDARVLLDAGFGVVSAACFDMFPQTTHVETLLVLER